MHHEDIWQVFQDNGQAIVGRGATADEFADDRSLVMGNAHVWLWRERQGQPEVLLQKRSASVRNSPGHHHSSASGHINLGESAIETACRETREEIGLALDPASLYLVQTVRGGKRHESINHVFVYRIDDDPKLTFDDGEVESVDWVPLADFESMASDPAAHKLVPQGEEYFTFLIRTIHRLHDENH